MKNNNNSKKLIQILKPGILCFANNVFKNGVRLGAKMILNSIQEMHKIDVGKDRWIRAIENTLNDQSSDKIAKEKFEKQFDDAFLHIFGEKSSDDIEKDIRDAVDNLDMSKFV